MASDLYGVESMKPGSEESRARSALPVDPDSLLAQHLEVHIHLYMDFAMFMACMLIFSTSYAIAHLLLDNLW
ncbi:hypothetical protein A6V36_00945 [Paraburkholderia ginsengiterrae]|uniref:Uncharacterized protein n=1 Tax=Paraburkholderia ginsengiterrae TaxID=1462993 RepID=A0A1A9NB75_9BURK|nr:hypothetical protein A6V36_00945 [Paraburkholderia ginsengiterrae]OAJ63951.1 hypothetical protein A6V37_00135 [Paraburkholderia ginsengiterrae]